MQIQVDSRTLDVSTLSGTVIQVGRRDRVTVHSTGGGGSVGPHGGYVAAPQVYSRSTPVTELWIRGEDGREQQRRYHNVDLPLREGHVITIADTPNAALLLANHSTGEWCLLNQLSGVASAESLSGLVSSWLSNQTTTAWVLAIIAGAVLWPWIEKDKDVEWWASALGGAVVAAIVGLGILHAVDSILRSVNRRAHRRMGDKLHGPVREIAEELLRNPPVASSIPSRTS